MLTYLIICIFVDYYIVFKAKVAFQVHLKRTLALRSRFISSFIVCNYFEIVMLYCRLNNFEASIFSQSVKTFNNKVLDINNNKLLKTMSFYVVLTLIRSNKYLFFSIAREFIICIRNYLSTPQVPGYFQVHYLSNVDSGKYTIWASAQILPEYTCAQHWQIE